MVRATARGEGQNAVVWSFFTYGDWKFSVNVWRAAVDLAFAFTKVWRNSAELTGFSQHRKGLNIERVGK
jgi:hypothetical protein